MVNKRHVAERSRLERMFKEPALISAAQVAGNLAAASAGFLAALGGLPTLVTGTIGPVLAVGVGSVLVAGGVLGAVTVIFGAWWLERVALLIIGLGWLLLLPASLATAARGSSAVWLVVALVLTALADVFKRYKRIQWAYLDPARGLGVGRAHS
jgi:hypothetical protein